jgi:hypothetical protein
MTLRMSLRESGTCFFCLARYCLIDVWLANCKMMAFSRTLEYRTMPPAVVATKALIDYLLPF